MELAEDAYAWGDENQGIWHAYLCKKILWFFRSCSGCMESCYTRHIPTENRNGMVVDALLTVPTGTCEREATEKMLLDSTRADNAYKTAPLFQHLASHDKMDSCRYCSYTKVHRDAECHRKIVGSKEGRWNDR